MRIILSLLALSLLACGGQPATDNQEVAAAPASPVGEVIDSNPDGDPRPLDDLIRVTTPMANDAVSSPLRIMGEARGTWFFEGDFPIALYTDSGEIFAEGFGHSSEEWMTEDFIPFTAELTFTAPAGTQAKLELMLNNPADDEGFDRSVIIPVTLK